MIAAPEDCRSAGLDRNAPWPILTKALAVVPQEPCRPYATRIGNFPHKEQDRIENAERGIRRHSSQFDPARSLEQHLKKRGEFPTRQVCPETEDGTPPPPNVTCGFGLRPMSKRKGSSNTSWFAISRWEPHGHSIAWGDRHAANLECPVWLATAK